MAASLIWFCLLAVFFVITCIWSRKKKQNLPPGPKSWPVVGCMWSIDDDLHIYFTKLSRKFGHVIGLWFGNRYTVVLSSPIAIREAYRKTSCSGRPTNYLVKVYNPNFTGIVDSSYGSTWKSHRKFAIKTMSGFGLGKSSFEGQILKEAEYLCSLIKETQSGVQFDPTDLLVAAVSNLVCIIVFGRRFDYADSEFQSILQMLRQTFASLVEDKSRDYLPLLRIIPSDFVRNHVQLFEEIKNYLQQQIRYHAASLEDQVTPRDYIDAFLLENKMGNPEFTEDWLVNILFDFFAAGTETTATALRWTLLYLSKYPEIQQKVYEEIISVVGPDRDPVFEDQRRMPFTEAVMCEVLRLCSVAPLALVHSTLEDVRIQDFDIPQGTDIYMNLWAMHHDGSYWRDPEEFQPERFLTAEGACRTDFEAFLPFGTGFRTCLGEQLAKMEYFLMLSVLTRTFNITVTGDGTNSMEGVYKLVYEPKKCEVVFKTRCEMHK